MKCKKIIFFVGFLVLVPSVVHAGGAAAQRNNPAQQRAIRQRMIEEQAKAIAQQRAQAIAQQQAQVVAQQQLQAITKRKAEVIAYQKAAIQHRAAAQMQQINQINIHQPSAPGMVMEVGIEGQRQPPKVKDVATLDEVVYSLRGSSQDWELIIDKEAKEMVVSEFIEDYREKGIPINKSPAIYVDMIDGMVKGSPEMLDLPFSKIIMVSAIMQYDYNNGEDKDALALKVFGNYDAVKKNKERLGL